MPEGDPGSLRRHESRKLPFLYEPSMHRHRHFTSSLAFLHIVGTSVSYLGAQAVAPPTARIISRIDTLHGEVRTDNYFWIRNKSDPQVIAYLEAENAYTGSKMRHTGALQKKLYDEMLGR